VYTELLLEKYAPRGKMQLARYYSQGDLDLSEHYRDIFARCLLCGACSVTCPSGVDLKKVIIKVREQIVNKRGLHPKMERVVQSLASYHNISDMRDPLDWREFLEDLPDHMFEKDKAEVVYFVGCVASFYPMVQTIPQNFAKILQSAGLDFSVLGGDEWCCGFPLIAAGITENTRELMEHNLERIKALGAKMVVFSCPSCYQAWKEHYDTDLDLFHYTQFIEKLIRDGKIRLRGINAKVTYHDPCDLGRNIGIYDAPRQVLKSIPGLSLIELEKSKAQSVCCGGGGNIQMIDSSLSEELTRKRIEEIKQVDVSTVVTTCQQCVRTMKANVMKQKIDLSVQDITELILKAIVNV
jgi:heterodisulfide reductase subunit D